jgi:predicted MFS family arabinose efflux permease
MTPGTSGRASRRRGWTAVLAAFGATSSGTVALFLTGALAPQIQRDLGIGDAAFGAAIAVVFATGGLGVLPAGAMVDRFGWRVGVRGAALTSLVGCVGIAVLGRSYVPLLLFLFLAGLSQAQAGPAGSLAIADEVPAARRGTAFGLKQTAGPLMAMLAGLSIPLVVLTIGWRWTYVFAAVIPVLTLLAVPRRQERDEVRLDRPAGEALVGALRARSMLVFTLASVFGMASVGALTAFIVLTAVDVGLTEVQAGTLIMVGSLLGLLCRVLGGWLADRLGVGGFPVAAGLLAIGAVGFGLLGVGTAATTIAGGLLAFSGGWAWTGLVQYGAVMAHPEAPASAASVVQVGMQIGGAVGPVIFGVLAAQMGYQASWAIVTLSTASAAALIMLGLARRSGDAEVVAPA